MPFPVKMHALAHYESSLKLCHFSLVMKLTLTLINEKSYGRMFKTLSVPNINIISKTKEKQRTCVPHDQRVI